MPAPPEAGPRPDIPDGPGAAIARGLRDRGFDDDRVLAAIAGLDRARFLPPDQRPFADEDRALAIGDDQTISQPYVVAAMTSALELTGRERVLEVGTGSGYQAAVLSRLAAVVYTVERLETLSLRARSILDGLGLTNVRYRIGDGTLGWPDESPFDRIVVTAAAPALPRPLFDQLDEGGLLVAPIGGADEQHLYSIERRDGRPVARSLFPCRFVKLIGAAGWGEG